MGMSYDFYNKHNMHAVEWQLNAMINKNKKLINKFDRNWRHPFNRKFESFRAWLLWTYRFAIHINGDNERCVMFSKRIYFCWQTR